MKTRRKESKERYGVFQEMVDKVRKSQSQPNPNLRTDLIEVERPFTVPRTPTLKAKFMAELNFQKAKSVDNLAISEKSCKENQSFGPKASFISMKSKSDLDEESPKGNENLKIFHKLNSLKENLTELHFNHTELELEDCPEYNNLDTLENFNNTDPSQIAKNEDEFWRYERKEQIIGKHFLSPSEFEAHKEDKMRKSSPSSQGRETEHNTIIYSPNQDEKGLRGIFRSKNKFPESDEDKQNPRQKKKVSFNKMIKVRKFRVKGKPKNLFLEN